MKANKQVYWSVLLGLSVAMVCAAEDKQPTTAVKAEPAKTSALAKATTHWAYQPVQAPVIPKVKQQQWVRTPIDAYVLTKLEDKNLKPSADTDRATYIRRATLDTLGYIPTLQEVQAFENDKSPNAYEKLVDRLLASPHYGERQARRWLDLARYADTTGFQNDNIRQNQWRYRDYVINAFNNDKPYDQFIKEQIAGDEIAPNSKEALIATGFLMQYPDNYNSRDLVQRKYQITTDITDTIGEVVLGQTVGCARCHDHKFDKISAKEYFQLQAFFANLSENKEIAADIGPGEKAYQQAQAKWNEATKGIRAQQKALVDKYRVESVQYQKERYLTDSRDSLFKSESEWNALDRWVNHRWYNVTTGNDAEFTEYLELAGKDTEAPTYKPEVAEAYKQYTALDEELKKFANLKPRYEAGGDKIIAATELGRVDSPKTYLLFVGNHEKPVEEVQPAFPLAIAGAGKTQPVIVPTATSSGRRTALANWIVSPGNPLTARVYVNRIWNEYFGRGIVRTVSDFGKAGERPANPELLDYLADDFVQHGWSIKHLHREILLSSVYRQSSDYREDAYKADPENKLLALFPRKRLDAEQIRDSLLVAAGQLNDKVGGPSVFPPVPAQLNAGNAWPVSKDKADWNRRSIYIFTRRSLAYPLLQTFDMSSPQQAHMKRDVTTTPLQALTLYNSELVFEWSQELAGKILGEVGADQARQVDRLYEILFARAPDKQEKTTLLAFLDSQQSVLKDKASNGKLTLALPITAAVKSGVEADAKVQAKNQSKDKSPVVDPLRASAFVDLVHTVANSNDFAYRF
ncbi:MAG: DUF1549 and DUF1553 domain-containing protein [Steroidobacteraceae bacterium]